MRASAVAFVAVVLVAVAACGRSSSSGSEDRSTISPTEAHAASITESNSSIVGADTLSNTQIGGRDSTVLAFRFRAQWTGVVRAVRFYVVVNSEGRVGYSGGTGGTLRVTLTPDSDARTAVFDHALASATVGPPSRDSWPLASFPKPAHVVAHHYYRVVFTNADRNPRQNFVSVNSLLAYGHREPMPHIPDGMSVLLGNSRDGGRSASDWESRAEGAGQRYAPILDVVGAGGRHAGLGYMEVWGENPKPIGGGEMVRQLLGTASGRTTIAGAWLRVRRKDSASAPLSLAIEDLDGHALASAGVSAGDVATNTPEWVHVRFASPAQPKKGERIALTATSNASSYEAFPIRKGTEFGFGQPTVFTGGYAQFDEGGGWTGWDQWGQPNRHDGDLQFALDLTHR